MSVKVFLPTKLFYTKKGCIIYGDIHINENGSVSYYAISTDNRKIRDFENNGLRHLGYVDNIESNDLRSNPDVPLKFFYDDNNPNIQISDVSIKSQIATNVNVFLFNPEDIIRLRCDVNIKNTSSPEQYDDISILWHLLKRFNKIYNLSGEHCKTFSLYHFLNDITMILWIPLECRAISGIVKKIELYEHHLYWKKIYATERRKCNIILDKIIGLCVMSILLLYVSEPGDHLIRSAHLVIENLRLLLYSLKGSPIGLKLNVHLNNFLLDFFTYHIDLWSIFLSMIEPSVRLLLVPLALVGTLGFSYQLAMLADLISIIGLHGFCFYIYSAVLYKIEMNGLKALWKVVLGRRWNVLKGRVESHQYVNRQLFLATLFFTTLLFLLPTILVYYIVFSVLRLCTTLLNKILKIQRQQILLFPLHTLLQYLCGHFMEIDSLQVEHIQHGASVLSHTEFERLPMSVFKINVHSSSLTRVFSSESSGINVSNWKFRNSEQKSMTRYC